MAAKQKTEIQDALGDDDLEVPFNYSITSYGADFPVDGLVSRLDEQNKGITIPKFQRGYIWTTKVASRFIESLLLGLPVPGIFLARESQSSSLLVVDGQQRLRSLQYFYAGDKTPSGKIFRLHSVQPQFRGLSYLELPSADRRRLDDSIIHATIVKQDDPSDDQSSIYHIFERINTGGVLLHPQEIRASVYHGAFGELLSSLNSGIEWRDIYGSVSRTMRDQELILRFIGLLEFRDSYARPMKDFLNKVMGRRRDASKRQLKEMAAAFDGTIGVIYEAIGTNAFRPKGALNAAVFDSVCVAVARHLEAKDARVRASYISSLNSKYEKLIGSQVYLDLVNKSTADEDSVQKRLELAYAGLA